LKQNFYENNFSKKVFFTTPSLSVTFPLKCSNNIIATSMITTIREDILVFFCQYRSADNNDGVLEAKA